MSIRKKISDKNLVIIRPNKWFLVRYKILFLFNKLLSSYLLRINSLDSKNSDFSNYDIEDYKVDGPRPVSARFRNLQSEILILEP